MRALVSAATTAALLALAPAAQAQNWSPSVNQRMTPPTSHADDYLGVSLSQLIVALGLTLGGPPPPVLDDARPMRPHQTAAAPEPAAHQQPAPVLPTVDQPVKSPEMR